MPNPIRIKTANGWQDLALTGVPVFEQASDPGVQPPGTIWIDTDDVPPVWVSPIPLVTSLPTNPPDGQEVYFLADATNGVIWHLRYRSASASPYKWEFVGGPPLTHAIDTDESTTTTGSWLNLTTNGPLVAVPLSGDYTYAFSSDTWHTAIAQMVMAVAAGDTAGAFPWVTLYTPVASQAVSGAAIGRMNGVAAGTNLKMRYYNYTTGTAHWRYRRLEVTPVRVG